MRYSIADICQAHGYSRQAYYKRRGASHRKELMEGFILEQVRRIRYRQPRMGVRKLYKQLTPILGEMNYPFGRDRLFELLRREGLLVKRRRSYVRTTDSGHGYRKYRNLIRDLEIHCPHQVYVSDITYLRTLEGFCYLSLITDACSRKIVGYHVSRSLDIEGCLNALRMALKQAPKKADLIHHSDRGIQYCSHAYINLLSKYGVRISMTERDHVYENALAERVNGILKDEFLLGETLLNYQTAKTMVQQAIQIYNDERPHLSLDYNTPSQRHAA